MNVEELLFEITEVLRYPVLILAMITLIVVIIELGMLAAEVGRRRDRGLAKLDPILDRASDALNAKEHSKAIEILRPASYSPWMTDVLEGLVHVHERRDAVDRVAKRLAEFDLRSMRRLERTRVLVRMGPALGLMGTLIPLSPALAGLSSGNVDELVENLRVAFGVTVIGLLVGALAYCASLIRDRLYAQDYSDLEYAAARLVPEEAPPLSTHPTPSTEAVPS